MYRIIAIRSWYSRGTKPMQIIANQIRISLKITNIHTSNTCFCYFDPKGMRCFNRFKDGKFIICKCLLVSQVHDWMTEKRTCKIAGAFFLLFKPIENFVVFVCFVFEINHTFWLGHRCLMNEHIYCHYNLYV